jgi:plasmid stabilization system protein ParE
MAGAIWTQEARKDLKGIALYIGRQEQRVSTAARIIRDIKAKCDEYATHFRAGSVLGTHRPELGAQVRVISHKRRVIVFRPCKQGIEVLRVIDGAQDYPSLFGETRIPKF